MNEWEQFMAEFSERNTFGNSPQSLVYFGENRISIPYVSVNFLKRVAKIDKARCEMFIEKWIRDDKRIVSSQEEPTYARYFQRGNCYRGNKEIYNGLASSIVDCLLESGDERMIQIELHVTPNRDYRIEVEYIDVYDDFKRYCVAEYYPVSIDRDKPVKISFRE